MAKGQVIVGASAAGSFAALARDLRRAGAGGLRKELYAGLQRGARPAIQTVRDHAATFLPRSGGLADRVAGASITARVTNSAAGPSARITAKERSGKSFDARALDDGRLRHPLYGNRRYWYQQAVTPGWFTRPMERSAQVFRQGLLDAVDAVERQITS